MTSSCITIYIERYRSEMTNLSTTKKVTGCRAHCDLLNNGDAICTLCIMSTCPVSTDRPAWGCWFSSLAPVGPRCHFKTAIFNLVLLIGIFTSSNDNALRWMPWDLTDDKSTLVQVMAWCRQATSHYLSQCWPSSMSPYGVTRPQWVNVSPW